MTTAPLTAFHTAAGVTVTLEEHDGGWPACDAPHVRQWSGYMHIPGSAAALFNTTKHYFYWMFSPRDAAVRDTAPVVLWMTGGPGCSSLLALLTEMGPCGVDAHRGEVRPNPWAWNEEAYLLFVDQPAGVGYSYADDPSEFDRNESQVADDMYHFVQVLMERHETLRGREWFVVGESYGGHYAPATAHRVLQGNAAVANTTAPVYRPVRLAGMAVGNGLTDSTLQYPAYPRVAHEYCRAALGTPCVSAAERQEMEAALPRCLDAIAACNAAATGSAAEEESCVGAFQHCAGVTAPYSATRRNPYDVRRFCDSDAELCYNFTHVERFLNRADVQAALGARAGTHWASCNMDVNGMFVLDFYKNFNTSVVALLEAGVRVMIYAGDCDFICNWIGNKAWLQALRWSGQEAFAAAYDVPFRLGERRRPTPKMTSAASAMPPPPPPPPGPPEDPDKVIGLVRSVAADSLPEAAAVNSTSPILLTFVQLFGAGHMVPMDQPAASRTMLHHFLRDEPFV